MIRGRLYGGLLLGLWACNAGPISDFPFRAPGSGDESAPSTRHDAGSPAPGDAGALTPGAQFDGGQSAGPADSGVTAPPATSSDGGVPSSDDDAGGDGEPGDGGSDADVDAETPVGPWACPTTGAIDECAGPFCGLTRSELSQASVDGACADDPAALSASCSGELSVKVAQCAQSAIAAGDLPDSPAIVACLGPSLTAMANSACVTCFADEASCALRRCGGAFLTGDEQLETACRSLLCGPAFSACSGLPSGSTL